MGIKNHTHEYEITLAHRESWGVAVVVAKCKDYNCEERKELKVQLQEVVEKGN